MKVRWRSQSFRLRISPAELESLKRAASVTEAVRMPGGEWRVTLGVAEKTEISVAGGQVEAQLSPIDLATLADPAAEGVYIRPSEMAPLDWFVEKDFPCVHPRGEEVREAAEETFEPPPRFAERHGKSCS